MRGQEHDTQDLARLRQDSNHRCPSGLGFWIDHIFDGNSDALTRLEVLALQNLAGRSHNHRFLVYEDGLIENQLQRRHLLYYTFNISGKEAWRR